ncbi:MAG TPA: hypothetical protein VHE78_17095 [Gemmatimonadaceae bacterium]|nr:hypothetical protein [Gemmatimonadaceae bacterium]
MREMIRRTSIAVFMLLLLVAARADAQNIVRGCFDASLDDGSLAGTTFTVIFSYDADEVSDTGDSYVSLSSFDFTLLGVPFTRDDIFQGGQAIFHDAVLDNVTASFQVRLPPNSPVNNITFGFGSSRGIAYIDLDNQFGSGSFVFSTCQPAEAAAAS